MFSLNFSLPFFFDWATQSLTCEMVSICMPLLTLILWKIFCICSLLNHNRLRRVSVFPYSPESRNYSPDSVELPNSRKFIDPQHFILRGRAWCLMEYTHPICLYPCMPSYFILLKCPPTWSAREMIKCLRISSSFLPFQYLLMTANSLHNHSY